MPNDPHAILRCARSPFKNVRMHALERLVAEGHPASAEVLLGLLGDPVQEIQVEAVRVAGVVECREALPVLLELLRSGSEPVALQAAVSLGELGHYGDLEPEAVAPPPPTANRTGVAPAPAARESMSPAVFYLLFVILSAGLFMSGYLFHSELTAQNEDATVTSAAE